MLSFTAGMRIFVGIEPVDMRGYAECGVMRSGWSGGGGTDED